MKCSICGARHEVLDPTFRRPEAVVSLPEAERARRVQENDDLCMIRPHGSEELARCFVRCTLKVEVHDSEQDAMWGLWAEVTPGDFQRIVERWSDPGQVEEAPMSAVIANRILGYPDTLGLPVTLRLTGPTLRPALLVKPDTGHPFAVECLAGVSGHRVMEWLERLR